MPLTRDFKETIRARAGRDAKFRKELLREGIESMLSGDLSAAKTILRDYINATVGFTELAAATRIPSKSLMRMLGPTGNPRAENLFEVVGFLQHREGVKFQLKAAPRAASSDAPPEKRRRQADAAARILEIQKRVKPDPEGWSSRDYINYGRR